MDGDISKEIFSIYGYDVRKLIEEHEELEARLKKEQDNNELVIIEKDADRRDYFCFMGSTNGAQGLAPVPTYSQGFKKVKNASYAAREKENLVKRHDRSWLLKDVLLSIKTHPRRIEPMVEHNFKPKKPKFTPFYLRFVEFGQRGKDGSINVIMSDQTHKLCCVFSQRAIIDHIRKGGLPFNDVHSIYNFALVEKANLKFVKDEYIKKHFNLAKVSSRLRYCVLEILQFKFVCSVKAALLKKVPNPKKANWEERVNCNDTNFNLETMIDSGEEFNSSDELEFDADCLFEKGKLKWIYTNDFYIRLCKS